MFLVTTNDSTLGLGIYQVRFYIYQSYINLCDQLSHCVVLRLSSVVSTFRWRTSPDTCFFFYTTDLHKHNAKTKSKLNKRTTEP